MAIPQDILLKWARKGKDENSSATYHKLRQLVLDNFSNVDIFLQGSYANDTNVRDNSDIDMVVLARDYVEGYTYNRFDLRNLKENLYSAINGKGNFKFRRSSKTIKYDGNSFNYVPADIVPACSYVDRYGNKGIVIYDSYQNKYIHNYPKQHIENGHEKSKLTDGNYKKVVRMFKNARNHLLDLRYIKDSTASSYFVECLLYNVPNGNFAGDESKCFYHVLNWLNQNRDNLVDLRCQNGLIKLFGNDSTQWNITDANFFIERLVFLWNNWSKI